MENIKENLLTISLAVATSFAGTLAGFLLGQSVLGQYFPGLISVAFLACTVMALLSAFGVKTRLPATGGINYYLFAVLVCSIALGSSISAGCIYAEDDWHYRLAGFIPYTDAAPYFGQITDWPDSHFNLMTSRRPMNAVIHIVEFQLGGFSLLGMFFVRAMLAAMAIAAFTEVLGNVAGKMTAWAAACLLLYWAWPYASMVMTEINGITWSAAGFALMLNAIAGKGNKHQLIWGLLGLTLATIFRPFNPLAPPVFALILVLGSEAFKRKLGSGLALGALTMLFFFGLPRLVFNLYGHPESALQGNFGATLLGLARGTNWMEAIEYTVETYPEVTEGLTERQKYQVIYNEKQINDKMYEILWPTIRENPRALLGALKGNLLKSVDGLFHKSMRATGLERVAFRFWTPVMIAFYLGIMLSMILLYRSKLVLLLALSLFGFFTFSPILYTDGDWRVAASLYPGLALLGSLPPLAAGLIRRQLKKEEGSMTGGIAVQSEPELASWITARVLILLPFLAIPYVAVTLLQPHYKSREKQYAFTLTVDAARPSGWSGLNSAVIKPEKLQRWFERGGTEYNMRGMKENAEFMVRRGSDLKAVVLQGNDLALVLKDSAAFRAFPDQSKVCAQCPVFELWLESATK